jgi:hypothetical protein
MKPANRGKAASAVAITRTTAMTQSSGSPSRRCTRRCMTRSPGVWPVVAQKVAQYATHHSTYAPPASTIPRPCNSCEPGSTDTPSATAPAKMIAAALTIAASMTNAIARVTNPAYSGRASIAVQQSP